MKGGGGIGPIIGIPGGNENIPGIAVGAVGAGGGAGNKPVEGGFFLTAGSSSSLSSSLPPPGPPVIKTLIDNDRQN